MTTRKLFDEVKEEMKNGYYIDAIKMVRHIAWDIKQAQVLTELIAASTWEDFAVKVGIKQDEIITNLVTYPVRSSIHYELLDTNLLEVIDLSLMHRAVIFKSNDLNPVLRYAAEHDINLVYPPCRHCICMVTTPICMTENGEVEFKEDRFELSFMEKRK